MATRIYGVNPGESEFNVREAIGPTGTSAIVALVVNLASNLITDGGTTRIIQKEEVLKAIRQFENYIVKSNWPPA